MDKPLGSLQKALLEVLIERHGSGTSLDIREGLQSLSGSSRAQGTVHTVLGRLERQGLIRSDLVNARRVRGASRFRVYHLLPAGLRAIENAVPNLPVLGRCAALACENRAITLIRRKDGSIVSRCGVHDEAARTVARLTSPTEKE